MRIMKIFSNYHGHLRYYEIFSKMEIYMCKKETYTNYLKEFYSVY